MSKLTVIYSWGWETILSHAKDERTEGAGQVKGKRTQLVNKETKESTWGGGLRNRTRESEEKMERQRQETELDSPSYLLEERASIPKFSGKN